MTESSLCEVSPDGMYIRRKAPLLNLSQYDLDRRTVYTDNYNQTMDHIALRNIFEKYGQVTYVSLPRFKGKPEREFKGFGFIEYKDIESVNMAVEGLNEYHMIDNPLGMRVISKLKWMEEKQKVKKHDDKKVKEGLLKLKSISPITNVKSLKDTLEIASPVAYIDLKEIGDGIIRYKSKTDAMDALNYFKENATKCCGNLIELKSMTDIEESEYFLYVESIKKKRNKTKKEIKPSQSSHPPPSTAQKNIERKSHIRFTENELDTNIGHNSKKRYRDPDETNHEPDVKRRK